MHDENRLSGQQWTKATVSESYSHKSNVKYTLELCQFVMSEDELNAFRNRNSVERGELLQLAAEIETRSFRKMWELEGEDPDVSEQTNRKAGSKAKKPTYGAVGPRVLKYKKLLCPNGDASNEPLRDRPPPEEEPTGTPQGNMSIRRAFTGV